MLVHQVSPDKYCQLVEDEGGLALVEEIVNNNRWKYIRWRYVGRKAGKKITEVDIRGRVGQIVEIIQLLSSVVRKRASLTRSR